MLKELWATKSIFKHTHGAYITMHNFNMFGDNLDQNSNLPLSSAEAYDWAMANINHDYQDVDIEDLKPEAFGSLDALNFTFTKSYPVNDDVLENATTLDQTAPNPSTLRSYELTSANNSTTTNATRRHHYYYDPQAQDALSFKHHFSLSKLFHMPMRLRASH